VKESAKNIRSGSMDLEGKAGVCFLDMVNFRYFHMEVSLFNKY
jgi:hypothetical protein